jgi:triosephosphate isomerase
MVVGWTVTNAIRCVGYDLREAEAEKTLADIKEQLATSLDEE